MLLLIVFVMITFCGVAFPKAFMPVLERVKKRVEQAAVDGRTMTLCDWLALKNASYRPPKSTAGTMLDNIEKKIEALYWAQQGDLINKISEAVKTSPTVATSMLFDAIKEHYQNDTIPIVAFIQDIGKEDVLLQDVSRDLIKSLGSRGDESAFNKAKELFNNVHTHFVPILKTLTELVNALLMAQR